VERPTLHPDPSPEARRFIAERVPDNNPMDFDRIAEIRQEAHDGYRPAVDRAIAKYELEWQDDELGGVPCTRLASRRGAAVGTLVYIFGGGFVLGDPPSEFPIAGALAALAGLDVVLPWYRLAPEHPAPAAGDDCAAVWNAVAAEVDGPLQLAGESAGGNLALLTAQRAVATGVRVPDALALLSPAVDLRTDPELFGATLRADPTLTHQTILDVAQVYAGGLALDDPQLSPLFGPMSGLPPTIVTTASRDLLLSMCLRLDRQMRRADVDVRTLVWDGLGHVFEFYDDYPEAEESIETIADFLRTHRSELA
jgi:acetyl esterase/lipase